MDQWVGGWTDRQMDKYNETTDRWDEEAGGVNGEGIDGLDG